MTAAPRIGVGVLVVRDGRVLLGRRRGSHGAGFWAAPGGHLEFGESPIACARRELKEETGLDLTGAREGPYVNNVMAEEGLHYVTLMVLARCEAGEARTLEPHKCEGWQWFSWQALPEPLFAPLAALRDSGFDATQPLAPATPGRPFAPEL